MNSHDLYSTVQAVVMLTIAAAMLSKGIYFSINFLNILSSDILALIIWMSGSYSIVKLFSGQNHSYCNTAATVTTNIEGDVVCPGEELIINCTSNHGTRQQRWTVTNDGGEIVVHHIFGIDNQQPYSVQNYHFMLISTANNRLVSTFSTVATSVLNDATVECADASSQDIARIKILGGLLTITICVILLQQHLNNIRVWSVSL